VAREGHFATGDGQGLFRQFVGFTGSIVEGYSPRCLARSCAGQPLTDYSTVARLIRETRTQTGLTVQCRLLDKCYTSGLKITDDQMAQLTFEQIMEQCDHEFAPVVDKMTVGGPAPLLAGSDGKYPVPQPGNNKQRDY
jgi:hypothetical protein